MLRKWFWLLLCSATIVTTLPIAGWWFLTRPEEFLHANSPDGTWSATIIRQQTSVAGTTDVILRIEDESGRIYWCHRIDERDVWTDVEQYKELLVDNDLVRFGPYWSHGRYLEVRKADAETGRTVLTSLGPSQPR